jgi:hypothetical protein
MKMPPRVEAPGAWITLLMKGSSMHSIPEIWKPVVGYEGLYEVSNFGGMRSLTRLATGPSGKGRMLRGMRLKTCIREGYPSITLSRNASHKSCSIHTLVMSSFVGKCPAGMEVAHNDGNRKNSVLSNLRYCTRKDNLFDRLKHGTLMVGEKNHQTIFSWEQVKEMRRLRASGLLLRVIANQFGTSEANVSVIAKGKSRRIA